MSFSLTGNSIVQSGRDTNLNGLSGIGGVTKVGSTYHLDGRRLFINGELTMNGWREKIQFRNSPTDTFNNSAAQISVSSTGKFTVQASREIMGVTVNRLLPVIDFGNFNLTFGITAFGNGTRRHIACDTNGEVHLSGIFTANSLRAGLAYSFDGTTTLEDVYFINQGSSQGINQQISFRNGFPVNVKNGNVVGYALTDRGGDWQAVNGLTASEDSEGFVWNSQLTTPSYLLIAGYDPAQISRYDFRSAVRSADCVANLQNCRVGNGLTYSGRPTSYNIRVLLTNVINITPVDTTFNSISTKVYATDVDNGNRDVDFTPPGQPIIAAGSDIVYTATGSDITFTVLSGIRKPDWTLDARGLNNGADLLFAGISYLHKIATFQPDLTGLGNKKISPIHNDDDLISEPNYATAAALININTAQQFYDRAKVFLFDNYVGETETIVTRAGDTVIAGNHNIVAVPTGAAFGFNGSTVTIQTQKFADSIATTGTVTLPAIADGQTITDSPDVTIATLPAALTLDNAVLNLPAGSDVTAYEELNGGSYKATADGQYIARLKNPAIIDANGYTITVVTDPLPTPSTFRWDGNGDIRWAIYDNAGTQISSGDGDKTIVHAGGVDTGTWTLVSHQIGHAPQIDRWISDDGSVTNSGFIGAEIKRSTGEPAVSDDPFPDVTTEIKDGKIHTLLANTTVSPQQIINSQQSYLNTDAGLNWVRLNEPTSYPTWAAMNGITYLLSKNLFTYDSVSGATPESAISATLISSATHPNILLANGGVTVSGGALTGEDVATAVWGAFSAENTNAGTMGEALVQGLDANSIAAMNTQT